MHHHTIKHIAMDDHKDTISVAVADTSTSDVRYYGKITNTSQAVERMIKAIADSADADASLVFWYEAGPCGYGLYRQIKQLGHECHVVAPSLTPKRPGQRIKTDQRDCLNLAKLARSGELTPVWVPDASQEAMRDLTRCREDAMHIQRMARQRLNSFLLRHNKRYNGKTKWTHTHLRWLDTLRFDQEVQQWAFDEYVQAVHTTTERVKRIDQKIKAAVEQWRLKPVIDALCGLRGINLLSATTLIAELGDLRRFTHPRQLMAHLGLVPSEHSSGSSVKRGGITRTGNTHARRMLIEAAWCHQFPARMTEHMRKKTRELPEAIQELSWKAQKRLCGRYRHLINRGKLQVQTCVAIARELVGFVWSVACAVWPMQVSQQRSTEPSMRL